VIEDSNLKQNAIAQTIADLPYAVRTKYTDFFGVNCTSAINSIFIKKRVRPNAPMKASS
jgi:hypothetical protein